MLWLTAQKNACEKRAGLKRIRAWVILGCLCLPAWPCSHEGQQPWLCSCRVHLPLWMYIRFTFRHECLIWCRRGHSCFFLVCLFYFLFFACFWHWLKKFKKFNFFALLLRHFSDSCLIRFFACLFFCCFLFLFLRFCELLCLLLFLCSFGCASVFFCFCLSANLQFLMSAFLFFCRWILLPLNSIVLLVCSSTWDQGFN